MRAIATGLIISLATSWASAQAPSDPPDPVSPDQQQSQAQTQSQSGAERSVLGVKPGEEALKNKDLYEKTGYFHPFRRMVRFTLTDQKKIWTSPFRTSKADAKWWALLGGATVALVATDRYTSKEWPDSPSLRTVGSRTSAIGAAYTLIPIASGFYFLGSAKSSERFRETGLLCFETLVNTTLVETILKLATDRERPLEGNGNGAFWQSSGPPWNASWPSGHAINTFGVASVFAHEYHDKLWVKIAAYGYAVSVVGARLAAKRHFPGDVVAGGAMGWFIGDYVYGRRHNTELDGKRTVAQKVLDRVHFSFAWN
jgi:membrane-associated phospholipid phosphatase